MQFKRWCTQMGTKFLTKRMATNCGKSKERPDSNAWCALCRTRTHVDKSTSATFSKIIKMLFCLTLDDSKFDDLVRFAGKFQHLTCVKKSRILTSVARRTRAHVEKSTSATFLKFNQMSKRTRKRYFLRKWSEKLVFWRQKFVLRRVRLQEGVSKPTRSKSRHLQCF
jgi:hypothetical protein